jgi:hypothetical protein
MFQSRQRLYSIAQRYDFGNRKPQPALVCGTGKPLGVSIATLMVIIRKTSG